jgi:hypothetical protein
MRETVLTNTPQLDIAAGHAIQEAHLMRLAPRRGIDRRHLGDEVASVGRTGQVGAQVHRHSRGVQQATIAVPLVGEGNRSEVYGGPHDRGQPRE